MGRHTFFNTAKYYMAKGFSVAPLRPRDKTPLVPWKIYQFRRPLEQELAKWFYSGQNNIAIVTGSISGICVLDFDSSEAYREMKKRGLPETPTVKTSRGYHLYFKYSEGIKNAQNHDRILKFDIRGDGGYVVAPPSIHPSGDRYQWVKGKGLDDVPLAELPERITGAMNGSAKKSFGGKNRRGINKLYKRSINDLLDGVDEGERHNAMTRIAGLLVSQPGSYEFNLKHLLKINQKNRPPLSSSEVESILRGITRIEEHKTRGRLREKLQEFQPIWEKAKPIICTAAIREQANG